MSAPAPAPFLMNSNQQLNRSRVPFIGPDEIGFFSLTGPFLDDYQREYHDDKRLLRPLFRRGATTTVKNLSMNLNSGLDIYIGRPDPDDPSKNEHLNHLLNWILHHPDDFRKVRPGLDIICWRGRLHELLCTPYDRMNGWIICACLIDGVVYITQFETPNGERHRKTRDKKMEAFMYWGYKFEQYMTTDPTDRTALRQPVNSFEGFHTVLCATFGDVKMLYGAEMDCIDPKRTNDKPPHCYVELKTTKQLYTDRDIDTFFDHKMRKWWAQSYMGGVPLIVVGFRDDKGMVTYTDEISTASVTAGYNGQIRRWSPAVCINFLHGFLHYVRRTVIEDLEVNGTIYKFEWNPGWDRITVNKVPANSPYKFIPSWYLDKRPQ